MIDVEPHSFTIRQGDRLPALVVKLKHNTGCCGGVHDDVDPAEFEGWTLTLYGPTTITGAMTYDADADELTFDWADGSTAVPGEYQGIIAAAELVTALPRTFPTAGAIAVTIVPLPS